MEEKSNSQKTTRQKEVMIQMNDSRQQQELLPSNSESNMTTMSF